MKRKITRNLYLLLLTGVAIVGVAPAEDGGVAVPSAGSAAAASISSAAEGLDLRAEELDVPVVRLLDDEYKPRPACYFSTSNPKLRDALSKGQSVDWSEVWISVGFFPHIIAGNRVSFGRYVIAGSRVDSMAGMAGDGIFVEGNTHTRLVVEDGRVTVVKTALDPDAVDWPGHKHGVGSISFEARGSTIQTLKVCDCWIPPEDFGPFLLNFDPATQTVRATRQELPQWLQEMPPKPPWQLWSEWLESIKPEEDPQD